MSATSTSILLRRAHLRFLLHSCRHCSSKSLLPSHTRTFRFQPSYTSVFASYSNVRLFCSNKNTFNPNKGNNNDDNDDNDTKFDHALETATVVTAEAANLSTTNADHHQLPQATDDHKDDADDADEETEDQKNRRFRLRILAYLSAALLSSFVYKSFKRNAIYEPLPTNLSASSESGLPLRAFIFSNILANRSLSRLFRPLFEKEIPLKLRAFMYKSVFGSLYTVEWDKFSPHLHEFRSFKDFFIRKLQYNLSLKLAANDMVSPCDGRILSFGEIRTTAQTTDSDSNSNSNSNPIPVSEYTLDQIKGVSFKLKQFLFGYDLDLEEKKHNTQLQLKYNPRNKLFYVIVYLAPGDYHRFHACADNIRIKCVNHMVGDLYPVKPSWLKKIPALFSLNERIILSGSWVPPPHPTPDMDMGVGDECFFSYVPVGAFNVGSIHLLCDEGIHTNQKMHDTDVWYTQSGMKLRQLKNDALMSDYAPYYNSEQHAHTESESSDDVHKQQPFVKKYTQYLNTVEEQLVFDKGDEVGYFSFGSTIVLVFEAPDFQFLIQNQQKISCGEPIGDVMY